MPQILFSVVLLAVQLGCAGLPPRLTTETCDKSAGLSPYADWANDEPVDVSVSLVSLKASSAFCDRFEPGLFGYGPPGFRKPDIDLRVWLREKNANTAHVATNQGYEIISISCDGMEQSARYNLFFNSQVVSRDEHLVLSAKIYENDQTFSDDKLDKLNKILGDLSAVGSAAVDKGLITKTRGDTFLNYFSILQMPFDLINKINEFITDGETLVSSFDVNMYRKAFFRPVTANPGKAVVRYVKEGSFENPVCPDGKHNDLSKVLAIAYEFETEANGLNMTFEIMISRRSKE